MDNTENLTPEGARDREWLEAIAKWIPEVKPMIVNTRSESRNPQEMIDHIFERYVNILKEVPYGQRIIARIT